MSFLIWVFIFIAIWQGTIIFLRAFNNMSIRWPSFVLFAFALSGVITYFMGLWG